MRRPITALSLLLALAATPSVAGAPFPCQGGLGGAASYLVAERFEQAVIADPRPEARSEYRMVVRNPHDLPAAVMTGIALRGIVEAPAEPVIVPPHGIAFVPIGHFPLDMSRGRMAPPMLEEVRAAMTIPFCQILDPGPETPSAQRAVPPGGVQVVRDEAAHHIHQRL
ncbi:MULTISPECIES: hypothetical protein [Roseomonadaceae]|uniref:Uncharacterized protein n=1 Tax=Falsiroseomonas oleicola TaxID=2801474 RepID=A0ABS6H9K8_9PROT|nr:hypothetical protein [Roseomonas oleicola]MBU8545129.1 hypothetical protein [Roseomonas oleicola]